LQAIKEEGAATARAMVAGEVVRTAAVPALQPGRAQAEL